MISVTQEGHSLYSQKENKSSKTIFTHFECKNQHSVPLPQIYGIINKIEKKKEILK